MLLDLLTVNIWGLPWPFSRDRLERKRCFLDHLLSATYDLVGIQELWWPWRNALRHDPLLVPRAWRDCGLALAGRLRVKGEARVRHYAAHAGLDRLKRKGVLSAGVELAPGLEIAVHVTHLQAGPRQGAVRARQVDELLGVVAADDRPAILMGDFNFHGGDAADHRSCQRVVDEGFADAVAQDADAESTYTSSNPYVRRRKCSERFDRVFLRNGRGVRLEAREVEVLSRLGRPLSDHHPVRVRARVRG